MTNGRGSRRTAISQFGVPIEPALELRERLANISGINFGEDQVFPELIDALLEEVPEDSNVLEVGSASGTLTRPLLSKAGRVTALEPSAGMLRRLLRSDIADSPQLSVMQGMVEDVRKGSLYDLAVVTFTPRRGVGLLRLLLELAIRVIDRVVMLLETEATLDWAYLARAAAIQGFDVRLHIVTSAPDETGRHKRAAVFVADVKSWEPVFTAEEPWRAPDTHETSVPYPPPRGTATRLVRFLLSSGDRALRIQVDPRGVDRLYGNLRTAAHRLARDEVTVRRHADGIDLVRLPQAEEANDHSE
jgi:hypothetical protein